MVGIAGILLAVSSCFVKEDRDLYPGRLILDFSSVDTSVVESLYVLIADSKGNLFSGMVTSDEFAQDYIMEVPRGETRINIWNIADYVMTREGGLTIPYGCECPCLYMDSFVTHVKGDMVRETVEIHKNYCMLTILVEGMESIPYSFTLEGNVSGYGFDGLPAVGDFSCVAYPGGGKGEVCVSLPRQIDDSLLLGLEDDNGNIKTFAVGEYMRTSGYDWNAPDLEDVTVIIDYYITSVSIKIQGWDEEYVYDIVL